LLLSVAAGISLGILQMAPQIYSYLLQQKDFQIFIDQLNNLPKKESLKSTFFWLSDAEIRTLASRKSNTQKLNFLISRYVIKRVVSEKLNLKIATLTVERNEELELMQVLYLGKALPLSLSLSHSNDKVLVSLLFGFINSKLGVDVEKINSKRNTLAIAESYFHEDEFEKITLSNDSVLAFYQQWTKKEALVKALPRKSFSKLSIQSLLVLKKFGLCSQFLSHDGFQMCIIAPKESGLVSICIYPAYEQL